MTSFETPIEQTIQNHILNKYWLIKSAILILLITSFCSLAINSTHFFDRFDAFRLMSNHNYSQKQVIASGHFSVYWQFIKDQAQNPLVQRKGYNIYMDHETNMLYRLCIPIIMRITHLSINGMLILQFILGIMQICLTLKLSHKIFNDKILAFYFSLAMAAICFGQAYMLDYRGYGDSWAFAFITFAIFYRQPWLIFIFTQMLFWVDERAIINTTFIGLWWIISHKKFEEKLNWKNLFKNPQLYAILFSGIVYLIVRYTIESKYHLDYSDRFQVPNGGSISSIGPSLIKGAFGSLGNVIIGAYEATILYIVLGFYLIYKRKDYILTFLIIFCWLITIFSSFMIYDSSRSIAFSGALIFIISIYFKEMYSQIDHKILLRAIAFFNLLICFFY